RKDEYYTSKGEYIISLEKVYETLFIESNKYMRKSIIEKGCEELKDVGVLKDYYFKNVGSKNEKLVMCTTEWQEDLLGKRGVVKEIGKDSSIVQLRRENVFFYWKIIRIGKGK